MIIPTLPQRALDDCRAWNGKGKTVVRRIVPEQLQPKCPNCQGMGQVFVSFLGFGPSEQPSTISKPSTYLAGDRAGWHVIENTTAYDCPVCHGVLPVGVHARVNPEVMAATHQVAMGLSVDGAK